MRVADGSFDGKAVVNAVMGVQDGKADRVPSVEAMDGVGVAAATVGVADGSLEGKAVVGAMVDSVDGEEESSLSSFVGMAVVVVTLGVDDNGSDAAMVGESVSDGTAAVVGEPVRALVSKVACALGEAVVGSKEEEGEAESLLSF